MSRTLFDQTLAPRARGARPLGTITVSIVLHAAAIAVLVLVQLTTSISGLEVVSPLTAYVAPPPAPAPVPPAVRTAPRSPAPAVSAAPTVALDRIVPEPTDIAPAAPPGPPTGLSVGPPGDLNGLFPGGTGVLTGTAPPPAVPPGPMRVGGAIRAPARLAYVAPEYPSIARTARVEGEVTLEATIDERGSVRDVRILHSVPLLDRAAIEAVSQWRYSPTELNGQTVAVVLLVRVKFTLK